MWQADKDADLGEAQNWREANYGLPPACSQGEGVSTMDVMEVTDVTDAEANASESHCAYPQPPYLAGPAAGGASGATGI